MIHGSEKEWCEYITWVGPTTGPTVRAWNPAIDPDEFKTHQNDVMSLRSRDRARANLDKTVERRFQLDALSSSLVVLYRPQEQNATPQTTPVPVSPSTPTACPSEPPICLSPVCGITHQLVVVAVD